jgi:hypothetical protein
VGAPLTVRDIADRLNALGLRVPTDPGPEVMLPPNPQAAQIRATGGRLIAKSKVALRVADGEIGVIARQMHALAQKTDPAGAPQITLGPPPANGTILQFRNGVG